MFSVYNSSKHSFSLDMKNPTVLPALLCAEHWFKYPTGREPGPFHPPEWV